MSSRSTPFWKKTAYKRLALALLCSALFHLLLVSAPGLQLPNWLRYPLDSKQTVQVVMIPVVLMPAPKLAKPKALAKVLSKPIVHTSKPLVPVEPEAVNTTTVTSAAISTPLSEDTQQPATPIEHPTENSELSSDERYATMRAEAETTEQISDNNEAAADRPHDSIEADFMVTKGSMHGEMHNSFEAKPDGSYVLKSVAEVKGLASLFLSGKLVQISEGLVTANGLQPSHFFSQYGSNDEKAQRVDFDWQAGNLTMTSNGNVQTAPLQEGTQDFLSFMYQFMYEPPLQKMQLTIANGKRVRTYAYSFEGEEQLTTKIGELRTIHIYRSSSDSEEKTELWLAADYHYMPVKIRKTEKDGSVLEQIITRIATSDSSAHP